MCTIGEAEIGVKRAVGLGDVVGIFRESRYMLVGAVVAQVLVDGTAKAWGQLEPGYYRGSRINVDGISLKAAIDGDNDVLQHFFDPRAVLDPARPASIAGS